MMIDDFSMLLAYSHNPRNAILCSDVAISISLFITQLIGDASLSLDGSAANR